MCRDFALPRTVDYLTSGISYAFHPHRDTWYSAPFCQINWWIPVYEIVPENVMAFHPRYWTQPVKQVRATTTTRNGIVRAGESPRKHIRPTRECSPSPKKPMELDPQIRSCRPGRQASCFFRQRRCIPPFRIIRGARDSASISEPFMSMREKPPWRRKYRLGLHWHDDGRLSAWH